MVKKYIECEALKRDLIDNRSFYPAIVKAAIESAPAADVIDKTQYLHVLKLAKKMHTWIFLNTGDEQAAYDEIGLTDEDNELLGYGGKVELTVEAKADGRGEE